MHWGCAIAYAQLDQTDNAVRELDAAHDLAYSTDSRVVRAISSLARARLFDALQVPAAAEATNEANLALHSLGIDGQGWKTAFTLPS